MGGQVCASERAGGRAGGWVREGASEPGSQGAREGGQPRAGGMRVSAATAAHPPRLHQLQLLRIS